MRKPLSYFVFLLLMNTTLQGQIVFNRSYDIDSVLNATICVIQTLDGGYITGGTNADISTGASAAFVLKTNALGDTLWTKTWDFSPPGGDQIRSIVQLNDSSYMAMGNTYDTIALNWDVLLLKINPLGDTIWKKTYSIGTGIDLGYMIKKTLDGGFIMAGRTTSNTTGAEDAYWIKIDSAGNLQWQYQYGGSNMDAAYSVDLTPDGGYILGGHTYSYGSGSGDLWIIKLNNLGIYQWKKMFGTSGDDYGETVISTLDGGYAISGAINDGSGTFHGYIVKTNNLGTVQWTKTFGYFSGYESLNVVKQLSDSSYVLAGSTWLNTSVEYQGWLMKIDKIGDSLWSRTYGTSPNLDDYIYSLDIASDGGFIIGGYDNRIGSPYQNVWLIKTDCMGNDTFWDTVNCSLGTAINVNNLTNESSIIVYPNPNNGAFFISTMNVKKEVVNVEVVDLTGKIIYFDRLEIDKENTIQLNLSLNNGMYFLRVTDGESKYSKTEKIIIFK